VSVKLIANDIGGHTLDQDVMTVDISTQGARLTGIRGRLQPGSQVTLARAGRVEQFNIAWVGREDAGQAGQIGVLAQSPGTSFWDDLLESHSHPASEGAGGYSRKISALPNAATHRI
jgi:hypothetical protein